jgi:hypothetical protein
MVKVAIRFKAKLKVRFKVSFRVNVKVVCISGLTMKKILSRDSCHVFIKVRYA